MSKTLMGLGLALVSGCGPEFQEGALRDTPEETGTVGQGLTFLNGSFETGPSIPSGCSVGTTSSTAFSGWTLAGSATVLASCAKTPANGARSIVLNSGTISQTFTTVVGGGYTVTFAHSIAPGCTAGNAYTDISYQGTTYNFFVNSSAWATRNVVFNATSTTTTLTFKNTYTSGGCRMALDNVTVTGP
ncbi:MAG TPA: DUF642 domain-containing protein [Myxococcaceae bacterium]|nr:DUF642 domain-containing protein [Myxococcaceae bacterium]